MNNIEDTKAQLEAILLQENEIQDEINSRFESGLDDGVAELERQLSDLDMRKEQILRAATGSAPQTPIGAFPAIVTDPNIGLEGGSFSAAEAAVDDISTAAARFASEQELGEEAQEDLDSMEDAMEEVEETAESVDITARGWNAPAQPEGPGKADPNNPVAMNQRLRREMGPHAADFLDEYAGAIHTKFMSVVDSILFALDLGEEDPTDGVTTLREELLREVGRRGVTGIEQVFPEWRFAMVKRITDDIKGKFQVEQAPTQAPDEKIPGLLGIEHMNKDDAPVVAPPGATPKPKKKVAKTKTKAAKVNAPYVAPKKEKKKTSARATPDAGTSNMTVDDSPLLNASRGPVSGFVSQAPSDFRPSGGKTTLLD